MDYEETKATAEAAWEEVLKHPMADLRRYLGSIGVELKGGKKPAAKRCPFCEGDESFAILPGKDGGYVFKCHHTSCPSGGESGGIQRFIEIHNGVDWKQARAMLHQMTGIPNPWDDFKAGKSRKPTDKKPDKPEHSGGIEEAGSKQSAPEPGAQDPLLDDEDQEPSDLPPSGGADSAPVFIRIPDLGRNVYEEAWSLLSLSQAHRAELRTKRGLDDAWIDALGFKTSRRSNRELLEPLLDQFPVNELLRSGVAVRDRREWKKLVVSDQLCGKAVIKDKETGEDRFGDDERIIIPYIDDDGRIVGLRPHKMGLSNSGYRDDEASEFYEKQHHNLRIVYGEHFLVDRPERHAHRAVICEGELKADALAFCGIPALGFQGIEYLWQNRETGQAERDLVAMLRKHKVREVVIVFDREDKSGKKVKRPRDYYIAEIWARYTAIKLENHGFKAYVGNLPESWMEDNKADWDSRLAWHVRNAKGDTKKGRKQAAKEFEAFLGDRHGRKVDGKKVPPAIVPVPRQMDWLVSHKEDVIGQELNRLMFEPDCFVGGRQQLEVAAEITGHCHAFFRDLLSVDKLAQNLRKCYGGYFLVKPPGEKTEVKVILLKTLITALLNGDPFVTKDKLLDQIYTTIDAEPDGEDKTRALRAALLACNTILYKNPKPFTDFTIVSNYKVLVTEADGTLRKDRLCVFIDANGRKSKPVQVDWSKMATATEARKIFNRLDGYHYYGGQTEIDAMLPTIDVGNYQQTIIEIDTYGQHDDSGIYLLGDCAWAEDRGYLFPDRNGIIWYRDIGYKNSDALSTFCHKPPIMFPGGKNPREVHDAIDWDAERLEVQKIWSAALRIGYASFGDYSGYAMIGGLLQYLAHPEVLSEIGGKPGLCVQGAKGSGKTQTVTHFMRLLGYGEKFGTIGLSGTKVGIERSLSQFSCLPVHIDEWRNNRASDDLVAFITNAFNALSIAKGTTMGSKSIRLSRAATIPVITGEDMPIDPALRSRYLRMTMSAASRTGTTDQQREGFFEMRKRSEEFYRIGRLLLKNRKGFGMKVAAQAKKIIASKRVMDAIKDDRAAQVVGICLAALDVAQEMIMGEPFEHLPAIFDWFIQHGKSSADDLEKDVFRLRWFSDCVQLIKSGSDHEAKKFLQVRRGQILADNRFKLIKGNPSDVELAGNGRLFILVAWSELFAAYQRDQAKQRASVPIDVRNIRNELAKERFWVEAPKAKPGQHRFRVDGFEPKSWWVMDYETAGDLQDIVEPIYRQYLFDHGMELNDEGKVVEFGTADQPLFT